MAADESGMLNIKINWIETHGICSCDRKVQHWTHSSTLFVATSEAHSIVAILAVLALAAFDCTRATCIADGAALIRGGDCLQTYAFFHCYWRLWLRNKDKLTLPLPHFPSTVVISRIVHNLQRCWIWKTLTGRTAGGGGSGQRDLIDHCW